MFRTTITHSITILLLLMFILWRLIKGLKKITGLETEEILLPR